MYERTFWLDHVEDQGGEVIQEGTPLDQAHFNKMEVGIEDANLAHKIVMIFARWIERRLAAIEGTSGTHTTALPVTALLLISPSCQPPPLIWYWNRRTLRSRSARLAFRKSSVKNAIFLPLLSRYDFFTTVCPQRLWPLRTGLTL